MDNVVYAAVIAAVSSVGISIVSLLSTLFSERRKTVIEAVTKNRMDWMADVRGLLTDFAICYRQGDTEKMRTDKAAIEMYMRRDKEGYHLLLSYLERCIANGFNEEDDEKLYLISSYVLARVWQRILLESRGYVLFADRRIPRKIDKRLKPLKKMIDEKQSEGEIGDA